jgi:hypothetical protein
MIFARCRCEPSFLIDKVPEMLPVEIEHYLGQIFRSVWLKEELLLILGDVGRLLENFSSSLDCCAID